MVIKDGRFGPYVTDGETNASLRKGDEVASITVQRGAELLAQPARRATSDPPPEHDDEEEQPLTPARSASKRSWILWCPGPIAPALRTEPKMTIKD